MPLGPVLLLVAVLFASFVPVFRRLARHQVHWLAFASRGQGAVAAGRCEHACCLAPLWGCHRSVVTQRIRATQVAIERRHWLRP